MNLIEKKWMIVYFRKKKNNFNYNDKRDTLLRTDNTFKLEMTLESRFYIFWEAEELLWHLEIKCLDKTKEMGAYFSA